MNPRIKAEKLENLLHYLLAYHINPETLEEQAQLIPAINKYLVGIGIPYRLDNGTLSLHRLRFPNRIRTFLQNLWKNRTKRFQTLYEPKAYLCWIDDKTNNLPSDVEHVYWCYFPRKGEDAIHFNYDIETINTKYITVIIRCLPSEIQGKTVDAYNQEWSGYAGIIGF